MSKRIHFRRFLTEALGYDLDIRKNDVDEAWGYTLSGQIYGFGDGSNYGGEAWLRSHLPDHHRDSIMFDSEQGQFFAYSSDFDILNNCIFLMDQALNNLSNTLKV